MPLPIDVGKGVVRGGRPNSVYGLSFHLSHHGTESMLLKKISDVVKETLAKKVKEFISNLQINMPLPIDVGQVVVLGRRPNSVYGLSFCHSHVGTATI